MYGRTPLSRMAKFSEFHPVQRVIRDRGGRKLVILYLHNTIRAAQNNFSLRILVTFTNINDFYLKQCGVHLGHSLTHSPCFQSSLSNYFTALSEDCM
ncbi:hypothetical protein L873DRAFT_536267 [Choiromyces venosus 120613-1]|uniref:Uncharacterized protein n=1 Tax=Choiromyces venosus 120613-1 TaxID=1336337 RepID=A0A3N4K8S1_9PEZI|nr:hypothetical protein L873DRAFT_536267 [Choiromyces venosus 120613-1]